MSTLKLENIKHENSVTNNMVMDSDGSVSVTNKLGVGTSTPAYLIDAKNTSGEAWIRADGSASAGVRYAQNGTNKFVFYHESSDNSMRLYDNTNNELRMKVDTDGPITTPTQPAFRAGRNSNYTAGAGSDIGFDNTDTVNGHFNTGGHYNTSNGRFTCPVAGKYMFYAQVIFGPNLTDGQTMDDAFYIHRNNIRVAFSVRRSEYVNGTTGNSGYYVDHAQTILDCSVNDYITINNRRSMPIHGNPTYCFFYGYLLG